MARLVAQARQFGVPPEEYARRLIEDGLQVQVEAERMTFAEIMQPVRDATKDIDEAGVVKLVSRARRGRAPKRRMKKE